MAAERNARVLENNSKTYSAGEAQHGDCESSPKVYLSPQHQNISLLNSVSVSQLHLTYISSIILLQLGNPAQAKKPRGGRQSGPGRDRRFGTEFCVLDQADHSLAQHEANVHQPQGSQSEQVPLARMAPRAQEQRRR